MSSPVQEQGSSAERPRGWLRWFVPRMPAGPGGNILFVIGPIIAAVILSVILGLVYRDRARNEAKRKAAAQQPLPVLFTLPDFSLTERNGDTVTLATLAGKVWIADFIFTTCPGPCPMMTKRMSGLQTALAGEPDIRLVTITVDPKRDTPQKLQEYAQQFGADAGRWLFLTGDREAIYKLSTDGFKMAAIVERDEVKTTDHPILHSTRFVLLDRQGRIRAYYDGTSDDDVQRLTADARRLAAEGG